MTRFKFCDTASGCVGQLTVPIDAPGMPGAFSVSAVGDNRADALAKAAALAERVASDPVLASMLPPQAVAAISAAKQLGAAAREGRGAFAAVWSSMRGPGKVRLAKALTADPKRGEAVEGVRSLFKKSLKLSPTYWSARATRAAVRKIVKRARRDNGDDEGDEGDEGSEVGVFPLAILAMKYGPGVAKAAHKAYKARKAAKARRAAASPRSAEPAQESESEPEAPDLDDDVSGGDWIDPSTYGAE